LVLAVFVAVFITGDVSTTLSSITDGSSMAMGVPPAIPPAPPSRCSHGVSSPTARSSRRELLVGLLIHHVHAALILIKHLHLFRIETGFIEEVGGGETLIERVARDQIAKTHLHERTQVAGSPMCEIHERHGWPSIMRTCPLRMSVAFIGAGT